MSNPQCCHCGPPPQYTEIESNDTNPTSNIGACRGLGPTGNNDSAHDPSTADEARAVVIASTITATGTTASTSNTAAAAATADTTTAVTDIERTAGRDTVTGQQNGGKKLSFRRRYRGLITFIKCCLLFTPFTIYAVALTLLGYYLWKARKERDWYRDQWAAAGYPGADA